MRELRPLFLAWLALLLLLAAEATSARLLGWNDAAPAFGLAMAGVVGVVFMQVGKGPGVIRVFAYSGVFWLLVLLGLGTMDPLTRHDVGVSIRTAP